MKQKRKPILRIRENPEFRRIATLSILCALGIFLGYFAASGVSNQVIFQLQEYLSTYTHLQAPTSDGIFLRAFAVYFRYCLFIFLLSFSTIGVYLIPFTFAVLGFSLTFAVTSFFRCDLLNPLAILSLFSLRCLLVLPTMLYFGSTAMLAAHSKENRRSSGFWRRFTICLGILLLGTILETAVVPRLFALTF